MSDGCGAPEQTATPSSTDTQGQVVVAGKVSTADGPLGGAYVRLLNSDGEFVGEVQASPEGDFRFYAASGEWTVRALHASGSGEASVRTDGAGLYEVPVTVG
ncbi:DUF1416 domain-containing protein [Haloechinothrix sp. LS1_15]|uniref:DUF1416 domain-containing protein n=1 Tax=Haloechinothrix sp. LS1_15 TaxID=2652248 RepID=UPI0029453714|nr:DUF1416 domain-containing protein [Haloechinothrix sp. LS1_15]MDV6012460.1 DUF1416 domain-containing protein [Haloechinothrix sp. LS1_15]